jgi:molybdopterin molybdotransferase
MFTIEQALERCLAAALPVMPERVAVGHALGRVLAGDVTAPVDLPPWDNSAMDGFAVRSDEATRGALLAVGETIAAGAVARQPLARGSAMRIMTGAPLPAEADAIVMIEDTSIEGPRVRIGVDVRAGEHVRRRGEDVRAGSTVLAAGETLSAARIGLCAALGLVDVSCAKRPTVAVVSTGDEVAAAGTPLGPGQIYSSNNAMLAALVATSGAVAVDAGVARDDRDAIRATFERAAACDLIVTTGGVSVGDFDHVKDVLGEQIEFWKVRMKPGKPLAVGRFGGKAFFGLPGNPVSAFVNFHEFVRPVIRRSLGDPRPFLPVLDAVLDTGIKKGAGREELVRVALSWSDGRLHARATTRGQGSHMLTSIASAHGFALVAADRTRVEEGETIAVQIFDPTFLKAEHAGYRW